MSTLISVSVSPANPFILVTQQEQFVATAIFSDAPNLIITNDPTTVWTSSQTSVATISTISPTKGLATALTISGSTIISATYGGQTGTSILKVGLTNYSRIFEQLVENVKSSETPSNAAHNPIAKLTTSNFSMFSGGVTLTNFVGADGYMPIGWTLASGHPGDFTKTYIANEPQQDGYWVQLNASGLATTNLIGGQRSLGIVTSISVDNNGIQLSNGGNPVLVQVSGEQYVFTSDVTIVLGSFLVPDVNGKVKATTFVPSSPTAIIGFSLENFASSTYPNMILMRIQLCGQ
jgi:hypothetical protein